jgi:hypothetical protein
MPIFLNTSGLTSLAIAICDRCRMKVPFVSLVSDTNFPGLRVCADRGCKDNIDPYRLPARKTERINLRFPRPDVSVALDPNNLSAGDAFGGAVISPEQNIANPANNGNLDGIEVQP